MVRNSPLISIGLPVRNGARFLAEAIDSLLSQSYSNFELIISDNASSDETEAICRAYASKDERIRYYRSDHDVGLANNFNYLFIRARGIYFKWAAADDVHESDWLARCLEILESDPEVVLAYGRAEFVDQDGAPLEEIDPGFDLRSGAASERLRYVIRASSWVNAIFGLVRSEALAKTQLFPSYPGGDYTVLAELALQGKFVEVPELLFRRRLHPDASSQNTQNRDYMVRLWTASGQKSLPVWRRKKDQLMIVMRSGLGVWPKFSLSMSVLRTMITARRHLMTELKAVLYL
jgi:glycosyltransferase involved in cell wall biosynthesis